MVNLSPTFSCAFIVPFLLWMSAAHPGEKHDNYHVKKQIDARQMRAAAAKRSLDQCQATIGHQDLMARSMARRAQVLNELREKRGISISKCSLLYLNVRNAN